MSLLTKYVYSELQTGYQKYVDIEFTYSAGRGRIFWISRPWPAEYLALKMGKLEDKLFYRYCILPVVLKCKQSGEIEETLVITNVNWLMNSGIYNFLLYNVLPICRDAQSNIGKPIVLTQYIANCVTYGFVSDLEPLV